MIFVPLCLRVSILLLKTQAKWVEEGFLAVENLSKKARSYKLAERFERGLS